MINFPQRNWTDYGGEVTSNIIPRSETRPFQIRAKQGCVMGYSSLGLRVLRPAHHTPPRVKAGCRNLSPKKGSSP